MHSFIEFLKEDLPKAIKAAKRLSAAPPDVSGISMKSNLAGRQVKMQKFITGFVEEAFKGAKLVSDTSGFAVVYTANKYAIRVTHKPDPAYERWIKFVTNPAERSQWPAIVSTPKIYISFRYGGGRNTVTIMEKLKPLNSERINLIRLLWNNDTIWNDIPDKYKKKYGKFIREYDKVGEWAGITRGVEADLHSGNIMMRFGGQMIFTDPVYSRNNAESIPEAADIVNDIDDIEIMYIDPELAKALKDT